MTNKKNACVCCSKRHSETFHDTKTYHYPLSELYFEVKIVITFTFSIWSVVMSTALIAAKENKNNWLEQIDDDISSF